MLRFFTKQTSQDLSDHGASEQGWIQKIQKEGLRATCHPPYKRFSEQNRNVSGRYLIIFNFFSFISRFDQGKVNQYESRSETFILIIKRENN